MIRELSLEKLKEMCPCTKYKRNDYAYAIKLFDGRDKLTINDIVNLSISLQDQIWVLSQMLDDKNLFSIARRIMNIFFPFVKEEALLMKDKELGRDYLYVLDKLNDVININTEKHIMLENAINCKKVWFRISPHNEGEYLGEMFAIATNCIDYIGDFIIQYSKGDLYYKSSIVHLSYFDCGDFVYDGNKVDAYYILDIVLEEFK